MDQAMPNLQFPTIPTDVFGLFTRRETFTMSDDERVAKINDKTLIEFTAWKFAALIVTIVVGVTSIMGAGYAALGSLEDNISSQIEVSQVELQESIESLKLSDSSQDDRIQFLERMILGRSVVITPAVPMPLPHNAPEAP